MPNERLPKQCYNLNVDLDRAGRVTWATKVRILLYKYGFGEVWFNQGVAHTQIFIMKFRKRLEDCYLQEWHDDINTSSKLSLFSIIKTNYDLEPYLQCIRYKSLYRILAKFRISNHQLSIETGRYENLEVDDRICKMCEQSNIRVLACLDNACHLQL